MQPCPDYDAIRRRIRQKRVEAGMKQERVAELVDVSPAYISRLETGRDNPSLYMLYQLAAVFECSVSDFLVAGAQVSSNYLLGEILSRAQGASGEERRKILQIMELVLGPAPAVPPPPSSK